MRLVEENLLRVSPHLAPLGQKQFAGSAPVDQVVAKVAAVEHQGRAAALGTGEPNEWAVEPAATPIAERVRDRLRTRWE